MEFKTKKSNGESFSQDFCQLCSLPAKTLKPRKFRVALDCLCLWMYYSEFYSGIQFSQDANCDLGFKNSLETFPNCCCYDSWKTDECFSNSPRDSLSSKSLLAMQLHLPKLRFLLQERDNRTQREQINTTVYTSTIILNITKFFFAF